MYKDFWPLDRAGYPGRSTAVKTLELLPMAFLLIVLVVLPLFQISCGNGETEMGKQAEGATAPQEDNRQAMGRIMGHLNHLEGELAEPVEAVLYGEVVSLADAGGEIWILLRVADLRCTSASPDALKAPQGSELSVRLPRSEEASRLAVGASLEINALISRGVEGPVIIGRAFHVL